MSDWRDHLTPDEAGEFDILEMRAADLDAERRELTARMNLIRNRCASRRTYEQHRAANAAIARKPMGEAGT